MASWYYNSRTGSVVEGGSPAAILELLPEALHSGMGWHGPFGSKQAALNYYSQNESANPGWKAPAGLASNIQNDVTTTPAATANAAKDAASGALKYSLQLGNTTGLLTRILKVAIGGFLLLAGIMKLTNADKDLVKIAGTAAKGAVLA